MNDFFSNISSQFQNWRSDFIFSTSHKRSLLVLFAAIVVGSIFVVSQGKSAPIVEAAPVVLIAPELTVDVAGGVKHPGVYSLPANSRVTDAIKIAGGVKAGTDTGDINLARIIRDGEQIYVEPPLSPQSVGPIPLRQVKKSGPLNINRATAKEFEDLPGIGPVLAERIFAYRKKSGPFSSIEDLQKVSGIGSAKFAELKSKVRV